MVDKALQSRSLSSIMFIVGAWLLVSPYLLGYTLDQAIWQQTIAGLLIAIVAAVRYVMPAMQWPSWITVALGAWLVLAPFITGYNDGVAIWNGIFFGLVAAGLGLWDATTDFASVSGAHHIRHHSGGAHPTA